ncbi:MAG: L17 family ribosomal protein [Candidatus Dojkabacteria bacterium]|nr:MAG: L17 family ribosomal protein [Candidatus Dojkabacteria bacterium]
MFKRTGQKKLGRKQSHRHALVKNQVRSLFVDGRVTTTTPKAKVLKANAESLLKKAEKGADELATVRYLNMMLGDARLVKAVQEYVAAGNTGVTIMKVGFRAGDNSEKSKVQVTGYAGVKKHVKRKKVTADSKKKEAEVKEATKQQTELAAQEGAKDDKIGSKIAKSFRSRIGGSNKGKSTVRSGI